MLNTSLLVDLIVLLSPNSPTTISSFIWTDAPTYRHELIFKGVPLLVAFLSTGFVLHSNLVFKSAKYVGVLKRGENKWEENINDPMVAKIGRGNVEKVRRQLEHDNYAMEEKSIKIWAQQCDEHF